MPKVEPKKTSLENKNLTSWIQQVVDSPNWQYAASMALAEYAITNPTTDELRGATTFLQLLTNLGDAPQERAKGPDYNLKPQPVFKPEVRRPNQQEIRK